MATIEQTTEIGGPTSHGAPAHDDPHATSTGVTNKKLAMWVFLASDCLFFGAFISAYLLYRGRNRSGPGPKELFDIPFTSATSFILLMSSLTMVLGARRDPAERPAPLPHLDVLDGSARRDVHRGPGVRVHGVQSRGV